MIDYMWRVSVRRRIVSRLISRFSQKPPVKVLPFIEIVNTLEKEGVYWGSLRHL